MRLESSFEIDLNSLGENIDQLNVLAPSNEVIFMIKGDAYGHGIFKVAEYSLKKGIKKFGVASLGEAIELKKYIPELKDIYIFSDLNLDTNLDEYQNNCFIPVLSSLDHLSIFLNYKNKNRFSLKFNTGMNRLGFSINELSEVKTLLKKHNISELHHVMTHFSHSYFEIKNGDRTCQQYQKFLKIKEDLSSSFKIIETSVSNSGAIEQKFGLEESHIRPGLMLYGPASFGVVSKHKRLWNGKIIGKLQTEILEARLIKKGEPIGYGGSVSPKDGVLLILPVGYADGVLNYYSGAKIKVNNIDGKIFGRINMDLTFFLMDTIDLNLFSKGQKVYFWEDSQESMGDFCRDINSIPYQVFTSITNRVPRKYT